MGCMEAIPLESKGLSQSTKESLKGEGSEEPCTEVGPEFLVSFLDGNKDALRMLVASNKDQDLECRSLFPEGEMGELMELQ